MQQVRDFNPSIAGTKKYWCLRNVRMGYSISPKYNDAKQAWDNTQQHSGNPPSGVEAPVFWSLVLTLDGKRADYGHIAVSMKDGRVWTDGRYYANIDTLNRYYLGGRGKYLGWGESVNGVRVIKKGDTAMKIGTGNNWRWRFNRLHHQLVRNADMSDAVWKSIQGKDAWSIVESWSSHKESNQLIEDQRLGEKARKDKWRDQIVGLREEVANLSTRPTKAELDAVKAKAAKLEEQVVKAEKEKSDDTILLDETGNWLTKLFNRLFKR